MFLSAKSFTKIENIQKMALRFMLDDYTSSYDEILIKANKPSMDLRIKRKLCIEIYKTLNNLNPSFMKELFVVRKTNRLPRIQYKLNLEIPNVNQVTFGEKSLRKYAPRIWNSLPFDIKSAKNLSLFKKFIKQWNGQKAQ